MRAVRGCQLCIGLVPVAQAEEIQNFTTDTVPYRVSMLFDRLDVDGDGRLFLDEWTTGILTEFPNLPEYARKEVPGYFAKYATTTLQGGLSLTYLDKSHFSKMYAAFLFRNFDADNNGYLDVYEAEKALGYLAEGRDVKIGLHPSWKEGDVRIYKPAFWAMYKTMMD